MPPDIEASRLKRTVRSFGFTAILRGPRVFVIAPADERIFIARKLGRVDYWELNETNRDMWEMYGALGFPIFPHIIVHELIKWFYEYAMTRQEFKDGLRLDNKDAIARIPGCSPELAAAASRKVRLLKKAKKRKRDDGLLKEIAKDNKKIQQRKAEKAKVK